jgi:hypothetical protein
MLAILTRDAKYSKNCRLATRDATAYLAPAPQESLQRGSALIFAAAPTRRRLRHRGRLRYTRLTIEIQKFSANGFIGLCLPWRSPLISVQR